MSEATPAARRPRVGRLLLPVTIFVTVYFAMLVYPPLRLADLLLPAWRPSMLELLVLIAGPILGRIAYELRPSPGARYLAAFSLTWLGCAFLLFALVVPYELVAWLFAPPERTAGAVILGVWLVLCAVSLVGAHRFSIRHVSVPTAKLEAPVRLVQISDVHIGSRGGGFLARVVERVRTLEPDVVMITGDLVDFGKVPAEELSPLATLEVPVFFCIGNHERYVDCDDICARLEGHDVRVLREAVDCSQADLVVVGLDDAERRTRVEEGLQALGTLPEGFRILLYHRPDGLEAAAAAGVDLMLCGHTHSGQLVPFNFLVKRVFPRIAGLYQVDDTRLYVSQGTGTWGPVMRLGTVNEITCLELEPAD